WQDEKNRNRIIRAGTGLLTSSATRHKPEEAEHHKSFLIEWPTIVGVGVFFLLLLHVRLFRLTVFLILSYLWWIICCVLWDIPSAIWRSSLVRAIRHSAVARFLHRRFATPLMLGMLVVGIAIIAGVQLRYVAWYGWIPFVVLVMLYNLPGWQVQEMIAEGLS